MAFCHKNLNGKRKYLLSEIGELGIALGWVYR
jgi:hypothetical protein